MMSPVAGVVASSQRAHFCPTHPGANPRQVTPDVWPEGRDLVVLGDEGRFLKSGCG
jgi:hypothetical protein